MSKDGIETSGNTITAYLVNKSDEGTVATDKILEAHLFPETSLSGMAFFACISDIEPIIEWERGVTSETDYRDKFITVTVSRLVPKAVGGNADLTYQRLPAIKEEGESYGVPGDNGNAISVSGDQVTAYLLPTDQLGNYLTDANARTRLYAVQNGEEMDIYLATAYSGADELAEITNTQTRFLPGALFQLQWSINMNGDLFSAVVYGTYYSTPAMTGGTVVSGTAGVEYVVDIHGAERDVMPTDWAEYSDGVWAYALKQGSTKAGACDRDTVYDEDDGDYENFGTLRLFPARVNEVGPETMETIEFDSLSLSDFEDHFETQLLEGKIVEVNYGEDTAKVEVGGNSYTSVPIHYHCENTPTISGGSVAFKPEDSVLIINRGGKCGSSDLKIVGFTDEVKSCSCRHYIAVVSSEAGNEAVAWDLQANEQIGSKDTLASVLSYLESEGYGEHDLAEPTGTDEDPGRGEYNLPDNIWNFAAGRIRDFVFREESSPVVWSFVNPEVGSPYFRLELEAFGADSNERDYWADGDYVRFQTFEDSTVVSVIEVHDDNISPESIPTFDDEHLTVPYEVGAINETWIIYLTGNGEYLFIEGETTGYIMLSTLDRWDSSTFYYSTTPFKYIEMEDFPDELVAPYLWAYSFYPGRSIPNGRSIDLFQDLTGENWPESVSDINREFLFFNHIFGVPLGLDYTVGSYVTTAYLSQLQAAVPEVFDSWKDADWSTGSETVEVTEVSAWVNAGLARSSCADLIFDVYTICTDVYGTECADYENKFSRKIHLFYRIDADAYLEGNTLAVFNLINEERVSRGRSELCLNPNLRAAAEAHAKDMADNTFVGHTGSEGSSEWERVVDDAEYLLYVNTQYQSSAVGENVGGINFNNTGLCQFILPAGEIYEEEGGCTPQSIVNGWMASPGHRANILYEDFTETGIAGVTGEDGVTYFCQTFGFVSDRWPGFGPFDSTDLETYVTDNFEFSGSGEERRLVNVHLVG